MEVTKGIKVGMHSKSLCIIRRDNARITLANLIHIVLVLGPTNLEIPLMRIVPGPHPPHLEWILPTAPPPPLALTAPPPPIVLAPPLALAAPPPPLVLAPPLALAAPPPPLVLAPPLVL